MSFEWKPGTNLDSEAIERMKQHFPKPIEPPFDGLLHPPPSSHDWITEIDPDEMHIRDLEICLFDTAISWTAYPKAETARERWKDAFLYLLPRLVHRTHESYLLDNLICYFALIFPDGIPEIYPQFRADVVNTLGKAFMMPQFWSDTDLSGEVIQFDYDYWQNYGGTDFVNVVSAAIYFCLRYLTPTETETWAESLCQIQGVHWHYNLLLWLYNETFYFLLFYESEDVPETIEVNPNLGGVNVEWSTLNMPTENVRIFIKALKQYGIYYGKS